MTTEEEDTSYIDYETFLSPSFSPSTFANSLVLTTNNPTDTPLDLSTPLSRVLFDAQEINTHIDTLTTQSALPLLTHTQEQTASSARIVQEIDSQVASLNDGYKRLEKEVLVRYETADEVKAVSSRLWETGAIGALAEVAGTGNAVKTQAQKEDHRALVRCSNTLLSLRELSSKNGPGEEGHGMERVEVIRTLQNTTITPAERAVLSKSQQIIREFSMSNLSTGTNTTTYAQTADTKSRTTSALLSLYLLSPVPDASKTSSKKLEKWEPEVLLQSLQDYLRTALTSSLASLSRALATLPTLERTLLEVSARCQNILALSSLLFTTVPPTHPLLPSLPPPPNFLQPLLTSLETGSLASYFWRTLAGGLSTKVMEIMNRGGVSARTLKSNRNGVRDAIRDCVIRGSQAPSGLGEKERRGVEGNWEREVAVMVGSVVGSLGR
ncbi:Conserved oligomeric Golgi complex subunit [Lachnellula willkommii]|uniref:Conserved oligomeric Golgi complex subunit 5 n=1 Tax=Lachnellula willkommii TaxID=215461 RepID=A0A559M9F5_9HELO|nr:Conserved oligomeric Golgi complex subunit [Lachnellula willkommii]